MPTIRIFRQYIRVPFAVLAMAELALLVLAVYLGALLRFAGDMQAVSSAVGDMMPRATWYALFMIAGMAAMGLYQVQQSHRLGSVYGRLLIGLVLGWMGLSVLYYVVPDLYSGRGVMLLALLLSLVLVALIRPIFYWFIDDRYFKQKMLVLGAGKRAATVLEKLPTDLARGGFEVSGFVRCTDSERMLAEDRLIDVDQQGGLLQYCLNNQIGEILVASDDRRQGAICMHQLLDCKLNGIKVIDMATFLEREEGKVSLDVVNPGWMVYSDGFDTSFLRLGIKRVFDVLAALGILLAGLPLMLLAAIAIKIEEGFKAPMFYFQERVGEGGKPFRLVKFRSMRVDAEKDGKARWAVKNDDRVTQVGRVIRNLRIDELPQVINVLRGDMSFVGPRPERPSIVGDLKEQIPYYAERHMLKPGITGWAQVRYPYGASIEDSRRKLEYDLYYVKNQSLLMDFYVMICTVEVVLFGRGR